MRRKVLSVCAIIIMGMMMGIIGLLSQNKEKLSDLVQANIEALSNDEGGSEPENEWWDMFNNYATYEWVSANSSGQYNTFTVTVNGVTISFKSEEHVTQCKVGSCHDGGNRDECYRSHWVAVCV